MIKESFSNNNQSREDSGAFMDWHYIIERLKTLLVSIFFIGLSFQTVIVGRFHAIKRPKVTG